MTAVEQLVWVEKYRPRTIKECVLPDSLKAQFQAFVDADNFPNLLLTGGAGIGKTSVAKAMCDELGYNVLYINASEERSIDVIRNKIMNFCATVSFDGSKKAVILDEADGLTLDAQKALRAASEQFHTTKFFFTCNYVNNIKEPIRSRTSTIDFKLTKEEKTKVAAKFIKRVFQILEVENITYDADVVTKLVLKYFPDNRRVLNELQRYATGGTIDTGVLLTATADADIDVLFNHLAAKDFAKMRKWVVNNAANGDKDTLIRSVYDAGYQRVEPASLPEFIIFLSEFAYKSSFVVDMEIAWVALFVEIMSSVKIKSA